MSFIWVHFTCYFTTYDPYTKPIWWPCVLNWLHYFQTFNQWHLFVGWSFSNRRCISRETRDGQNPIIIIIIIIFIAFSLVDFSLLICAPTLEIDRHTFVSDIVIIYDSQTYHEWLHSSGFAKYDSFHLNCSGCEFVVRLSNVEIGIHWNGSKCYIQLIALIHSLFILAWLPACLSASSLEFFIVLPLRR